MELLQSVRL